MTRELLLLGTVAILLTWALATTFTGISIYTQERAYNKQEWRFKSLDKLPRMCYHLYNRGKHREWAACMGVPYVTQSHTRVK